MSTLEKYFLSQLNSHHCQLPPSDDFEYMQQIGRFKNFFLISEKSLHSYLRLKSLSAIYYEKRHQIRTGLGLVIHPFSRFRILCQFVHFFLLLAALLYFPFFCAFHGPLYARRLLATGQDLTTFYALLGVIFMLQVFFLVQIVISFVTGYAVVGKEEIIIHRTGIARHYLCTYFLPDLLSSLPLDALFVAIRGVREYSELSRVEVTFLSIFPLLKFARLGTLNQCFRVIYERFYSSNAAYDMVKIIGLYFLIIHWCGCLLMLFSRWLYFRSIFADFKDIRLHDNLPHLYVTCLYVSLTTLVNTGLDIKVYSKVYIKALLLVLLIFGKVFRIIVLIFFLQLLSTRMAAKLRYMEIMSQVTQYMRMKRFPPELQRKVRINYIFLFKKEYIGEENILRLLSENLRRETLLVIHRSLIEKVELFSGLGQDAIYDLISCLKPEIYLTNDVVYQAGDLGECMYFVSFGTLAIYSETKEEICHLHDGDYFGEICVLFQLRRTATVVALETTELYSLDAQDLLDLIKIYPLIYSKLETLAKARLQLTQDVDLSKVNVDLEGQRARRERRDEGESENDIKSDSD